MSEPEFVVESLTDMPIGDSSLHFRMKSPAGGKVDFGIFDGEMTVYSWDCPKDERTFLQRLEEYAKERKYNLTIPIAFPELEKILRDNGYTMKEVPYMGDTCELWSKGARE